MTITTNQPATPALRTADDVRAAAHQLTAAADAYDRRLKAEAGALSSGEIFGRLQEEQRLRGIANQLFFEASRRTLDFELDDQQALVDTLAQATQRLASFDKFEHVTSLVTDLLVLGGAIVSGKASPLLAALKEVRHDVAALKAAAPPRAG